MTMRLTQLNTHWDASDANTVIEFLDELRDVLWTAYGDEIIAMRQAEISDNELLDPEFDDELTF